MNIIDILWKLGYNVHSFNNGVYEISFSTEKIRRLRKRIESGEVSFEGDMHERFSVEVGKVCFNGLGNLYVEFVDAEDMNKCMDVYEYKNMSPEELYGE